jgi:hypothetical protein
MTSPSSQDILAISSSMLRRNAAASSRVTSPLSAMRKIRLAWACPSGSVRTSSWLWSADVAPWAMK